MKKATIFILFCLIGLNRISSQQTNHCGIPPHTPKHMTLTVGQTIFFEPFTTGSNVIISVPSIPGLSTQIQQNGQIKITAISASAVPVSFCYDVTIECKIKDPDMPNNMITVLDNFRVCFNITVAADVHKSTCGTGGCNIAPLGTFEQITDQNILRHVLTGQTIQDDNIPNPGSSNYGNAVTVSGTEVNTIDLQTGNTKHTNYCTGLEISASTPPQGNNYLGFWAGSNKENIEKSEGFVLPLCTKIKKDKKARISFYAKTDEGCEGLLPYFKVSLIANTALGYNTNGADLVHTSQVKEVSVGSTFTKYEITLTAAEDACGLFISGGVDAGIMDMDSYAYLSIDDVQVIYDDEISIDVEILPSDCEKNTATINYKICNNRLDACASNSTLGSPDITLLLDIPSGVNLVHCGQNYTITNTNYFIPKEEIPSGQCQTYTACLEGLQDLCDFNVALDANIALEGCPKTKKIDSRLKGCKCDTSNCTVNLLCLDTQWYMDFSGECEGYCVTFDIIRKNLALHFIDYPIKNGYIDAKDAPYYSNTQTQMSFPNDRFTGNVQCEYAVTSPNNYVWPDYSIVSVHKCPKLKQGNIQHGITLAPNPASDATLITSKKGDIKAIVVFDCLGKLMMNQSFGEAQIDFILETETYTNGTYFIQVRKSTGEVENLKLVIQK